jgi:cytochrome P450
MDQEVLHSTASAHERLRRPLNRAFNPATFERLRPHLESLADELLAQGERRKSMDLVTDYARPLVEYMVGELLGLPPNDRAKFIKDCDRIRNFFTGQRMDRDTVLKAKGAAKSFEAVRTSMRPLIAFRRKNLTHDFIGQLFATEENEIPFSEEEVLANCVLFLHAGAQNTAASITNAVLVLLRHPEQFATLRSDPDLLPIAIEELLRYEPPLQVLTRGVPDEIEFAGQRIGPRQMLVLLLGAANRDPEQFADPDRLDLTRKPNRHVSFGVGPHGCVGAWLARFGMAIALGGGFYLTQSQPGVFDTPFWHFFLALYVAFLVVAAAIFAIRSIVSSIRG